LIRIGKPRLLEEGGYIINLLKGGRSYTRLWIGAAFQELNAGMKGGSYG
jgi:hypothetical protein